ncbi:hypothetical protein U1Q18_036846 [Sarracenia purpurea var. burkii]
METIEPTTPAKTLEAANIASTHSTSPLGLGSDSFSVSGTARRRSLRIASIRSVGEITPSVAMSTRKRKSVVSESRMNRKNECGLENVGRGRSGVNEIRVSDSPVEKVRVSDRIRMRNGVFGELEVAMVGVEKGRNEAVSVEDEVTVGRGVSEIESPDDLRSLRNVSGRVASDKKGRKRKGELVNGVDLWASESVNEDWRDNGFLSLRTGKKISKKAMGGSGGDDGFVGFENGDGDIPAGADGGRLLNNVGIEEGDLMNKSRRFPGSDGIEEGDGIGTLKGRRSGSDLNIRSGNLVETVEFDLGYKAEISVGSVLDNVPTSDENGTDIKARKRLNSEDKRKGKVHGDDLISNDNSTSDIAELLENTGPKELEEDPIADENRTDDSAGRRLRREEKGKGKMVEDGLSANDIDSVELDLKSKPVDSTKDAVSGTHSLAGDISVQANVMRGRDHKKRFRDIAKQNASRFAHFSSQEVAENNVADEAERENPGREPEREVEDWPGPFSTAMKIIKDRKMNVNVLQKNTCLDKSETASVIWIPKNDQNHDVPMPIPTLQDLCMAILAKNADAITSLDSVPDMLRHKLSQLLCDSKRMNSHFVELLVQGSPTEIRIRDCSWLAEEKLRSTFEGCETNSLVVLQLDLCGRCLPDYVLVATLAGSPNSLPALTTVSLKGAYRLSDAGLSALVTSAPALRSINLSQCSLLTSDGINTLADSLGSILRELHLDYCENIDVMRILPAMLKLEHLEVLSLAGIETVCDDFLIEFIAVRGCNIKELVLADCVKLSDSSMKIIAKNCTGLFALDLGNLCRLTDATMGYLANGCRAIQTFKLRRNSFSDDAVAAYLEASGESLKELSLNNISKVSHNTAISLSKLSKLFSLDLSWCRNITNEALGLIVDGCLSLKVLKLFGCTQITNVFLEGHSNPHVQIIGLKMSSILEHLKVPDPLQAPLHYSGVSS